MRKVTSFLLISILLSLYCLTAGAKVIYVKSGSTGDGSTWQNAYGSLQDAIDAAQSGDEIWIAQGVYKPEKLIKSNKKNSKAFIFKDGVSLYGGFYGNETFKDERVMQELQPYAHAPQLFLYQTVLDADDDVKDVWEREIEPGTSYRYSWKLENNEVVGTAGNSCHVLYCEDEIINTVEINGLTLKGANAKEWKAKAAGGALYAKGNVKLTNCVIMENQAWFKAESMTCSDTFGGAVYIDGGADAEISNCEFSRNYCHSSYGCGYGGAVYAKNVKITDCVFNDCVGLDGGGAVYNIGGTISNSLFEDCYSSAGGAVYNNEGVLEHNEIYNCRALMGGGIANIGTVRHSIIAGCYADAEEFGEDSGKGGGIWNEKGEVRGCVIYNNKASAGGGVAIKDGFVISCTIQNNSLRAESDEANLKNYCQLDVINVINTIANPGNAAASNFVQPTSFTGNASTDEQLMEIKDADWHLADGSEFIDTGDTYNEMEEFTIDGSDRVMGAAIDRGAYESEAKKESVPAMIITFENSDTDVRIGVGGATGSVFYIDWGDGAKAEHSEAAYYEGKVKGNVMKVYGDDIQVLYAQGQGISALDVSNATNLGKMLVGQNKLKALDVHNNLKLHGLYCESNQLESLDVSANKALKVLDCSDNLIFGTIDCSAMDHLSKVDCSYNVITDLKLPHHSTVYEVSCSNNIISSLDVSGLTGLDQLDCHTNLLDSLNVDDLVNATELSAYGNQLKYIDVSSCVNLKTLTVAENQLEKIDVSANSNLEGLYLFDNNLKSLDITNNPNIRWLNIENNSIEGYLNTSAQSMLSLIIANNNNIDEVNFENNLNCLQVQFANNLLAGIDVSMLGSLSWLKVDGNKLTSVDLAANEYLYWLEIGRNNVTTLDIAKNKYVQRLEAEENLISTLLLPATTAYEGVKLQYNNLDEAAINGLIAKLKDVSDLVINENNEGWGRELDISYMPGTAGADVAAAEAKGWNVKADVPMSIENAEGEGNIIKILYYDLEGKEIDKMSVPGIYLVKYVYADGTSKTEKVIIK